MTRNRLLLGIVFVAVLVILALVGLAQLRDSNSKQARVDRRFPLQKLGYCSSGPVKPCVVSFSQDSDGKMLVSFLTEGAFYPDFYLTIRTDENDHIYVCEKIDRFATSVYCTGKALPVGAAYQFLIFSINEEVLLAQGSFPIIGLALAMPDIYSSPTPSVTLAGFPTPESTLTPSYPSYP